MSSLWHKVNSFLHPFFDKKTDADEKCVGTLPLHEYVCIYAWFDFVEPGQVWLLNRQSRDFLLLEEVKRCLLYEMRIEISGSRLDAWTAYFKSLTLTISSQADVVLAAAPTKGCFKVILYFIFSEDVQIIKYSDLIMSVVSLKNVRNYALA